MNGTYAGVAIDDLRHLPHDTRRRLLRHLDAECAQAGIRAAHILDRRAAAAARDLTTLLTADADPTSVIQARRHALLTDLRRSA